MKHSCLPLRGTLFLTVETIPASSSTVVAVLRIRDQSRVMSWGNTFNEIKMLKQQLVSLITK